MTAEVDDLKFDVERLEKAVDVLAASVNAATIRAETAEAEAERMAWERTAAFNERDEVRAVNQRVAVILARLWAIDPADHATKSRDYGRGFAEAIRLVRAALGEGQ